MFIVIASRLYMPLPRQLTLSWWILTINIRVSVCELKSCFYWLNSWTGWISYIVLYSKYVLQQEQFLIVFSLMMRRGLLFLLVHLNLRRKSSWLVQCFDLTVGERSPIPPPNVLPAVSLLLSFVWLQTWPSLFLCVFLTLCNNKQCVRKLWVLLMSPEMSSRDQTINTTVYSMYCRVVEQ